MQAGLELGPFRARPLRNRSTSVLQPGRRAGGGHGESWGGDGESRGAMGRAGE